MTASNKRNRRENEWMDAIDADPGELERSLKFIQRINQLLRYTKTTLDYFSRFSRSWSPAEKISILDVATGSADVPRALLAWAQKQKIQLKIVGIDLHPVVTRVAAEESKGALQIVRADAHKLPFADGTFDYSITSMFLHHLDEQDVVTVLREMDRVARRGIVIADLLRTRRAALWINLFSLFATKMARHDGMLSVAQAFTKNEIMDLCAKAGLKYVTYRKHFGHRFVVAGERAVGRHN